MERWAIWRWEEFEEYAFEGYVPAFEEIIPELKLAQKVECLYIYIYT